MLPRMCSFATREEREVDQHDEGLPRHVRGHARQAGASLHAEAASPPAVGGGPPSPPTREFSTD